MEDDLRTLLVKCPNWSLAEDNALCTFLDRISSDLTSRCDTLKQQLESTRKRACRLDASVQNLNVEISILANTKFIEVVVDEEDSRPELSTKTQVKTAKEKHEEVISVVNFAVQNGLSLLSRQSNQEAVSELPVLIGSDEFFNNTAPPVAVISADEPSHSNSGLANGGTYTDSVVPPAPPLPVDLLITSKSSTSRLPPAHEPLFDSNPKIEDGLAANMRSTSVKPQPSGKSLFDDDSSETESDTTVTEENDKSFIPPEDSRIMANGDLSSTLPSRSQEPVALSASDLIAAASKLKKRSTAGEGVRPTEKPPLRSMSTSNQEPAREAKQNSEAPAEKSEHRVFGKLQEGVKKSVQSKIFDSLSDDSDTDLFKPAVGESFKPTSTSTTTTDKKINEMPAKPEPALKVTNGSLKVGPMDGKSKIVSKFVSHSIFDSDSDDDDLFKSIGHSTATTKHLSDLNTSSSIKPSNFESEAKSTVPTDIVSESASPPLSSYSNTSTSVSKIFLAGSASDSLASVTSSPSVDTQVTPPLVEVPERDPAIVPIPSSMNQSRAAPKKLNNSAFANLLNGKLAMGGPPPKPVSVKPEVAVVENVVPSSEPINDILDAKGDKPNTSSSPELLVCLTKKRARGPARRAPSKRFIPNGSGSDGISSGDVDNIQEKLAHLTADDTPSSEPIVENNSPPVEESGLKAGPKKVKGLFDSDSEDEPVEPIKEVASKEKIDQGTSIPSISGKSVTKPVRKGLFDDSDEDDLSIFMKK